MRRHDGLESEYLFEDYSDTTFKSSKVKRTNQNHEIEKTNQHYEMNQLLLTKSKPSVLHGFLRDSLLNADAKAVIIPANTMSPASIHFPACIPRQRRTQSL